MVFRLQTCFFFLGFIGIGRPEEKTLGPFIRCGSGDAAFGQVSGDGADAVSAQIERVNAPDDGGGIVIHDELMAVMGIFFIPITGEGADELSVLHLFMEDGAAVCRTGLRSTIH